MSIAPHTDITTLKRVIGHQNHILTKYDAYKNLERQLREVTTQRDSIISQMNALNLSDAEKVRLSAVYERRMRLIQQLAVMENRVSQATQFTTTSDTNGIMKTYLIPVNLPLEDVNTEVQYHNIADKLEKHIGRNKAKVMVNVTTVGGKNLFYNLTSKPFMINSYSDIPSEEEVHNFINGLRTARAENNSESDYNNPASELTSISVQIFFPYSTGRGFIERYFPKALLLNNNIIVPRNLDDNCFQHALIVTHEGAKNNSNKISRAMTSKYSTATAKKFWALLEPLKGPMQPTSPAIEEVELLIQTNINIYYFPHNDPIRLSKYNFEKTANLLLFHSGKYAHYCAILKLDAYLKTYKTRQSLTCDHCGQSFNRVAGKDFYATFEKHQNACRSKDVVTVYKYPPTFYGAETTARVAEPLKHAIYCDFEATTDGVHRPYAYGLSLVSTSDESSEVIYSRTVVDPNGKSLLKSFYEELQHCLQIVSRELSVTYEINGTIPPKPRACEHCKKIDADLVRDHDHYKKFNNFRQWLCSLCNSRKCAYKIAAPILSTKPKNVCCSRCGRGEGVDSMISNYNLSTGRFSGAFHFECLQKRRRESLTSRNIPIVIHNRSGYDDSFILRGYNLPFKVSAVVKNTESLISWTAGPFHFIDSYRFWASPLKKMFDSLVDTPLTDAFVGNDEYVKTLLKSKMVFPYEWFKHDEIAEQLKSTTFPNHEDFYSTLTETNISEADYNAAKTFFVNKCKTMTDFVKLYQQADVVQLADSMEFLRRTVRKQFNVEPYHSESAPGFSFHCFLNVATKAHAETSETPFSLSTLPYEQLEFFSQVRGGISCAMKRYANSEDGLLLQYDANSLYPSAMSSYMPYSDFTIMETPPTIEEIMNHPDDDDIGYQVMIDIPKQSKEFQDRWSDMPPVTTHLTPDPERFSDCQKKNVPPNYKPSEKLIGTFLELKGYTIHYRLLKFLLNRGFKCTITRAISFKQAPFFRPFVQLGSKLRTTDAEAKEIYKLILNSVYGKTLQSELKQSSCETTSDLELIRKSFLNPSFQGLIPISDNIFTILKAKEEVCFKSCRHLGAVILDESKLIMFKHYDTVKTAFPGAKLLYTDTDSHIWQFPKGVTRDMVYEMLPFDHSGLPKDNKHYNTEHKSELGYVKDEYPELSEFVALAPKVYSLKASKTINHAKGISSRYVSNELTFEDYVAVLNGQTLPPVSTKSFQSNNFVLTTTTTVKKNISNFDDKRYILDDGISTLPYGHYSLEETDLAKENHLAVIEAKLKWYETFKPEEEVVETNESKTLKRSPQQQAAITAKRNSTIAKKKRDEAQKKLDGEDNPKNRNDLARAEAAFEAAEKTREEKEKIYQEWLNDPLAD